MSKDITQSIVEYVRKKHKDKEVIVILSDSGIECRRISTQCYSLDSILGGGLPLGKIIEIYGNEGSGKTTLAMHLLVEAQRLGGLAALIDMENAFDIDYAATLGIDVDKLIFSQPESGNEAMEIAYDIMTAKMESSKKDIPLVIVVDSVAALASSEEMSKGIADLSIAPIARLLSQSLRKLRKIITDSNTVFIFLNQIREKVNIWGRGGFYSHSPGGRALKFFATVRLELRITQQLKEAGEKVGQTVMATVVKNRTYPPFKKAEFRIIWGKGIDGVYSLFEAAVDKGVIEKKGNWYKFGQLKEQGVFNFCRKLSKEDQLVAKIRSRLN